MDGKRSLRRSKHHGSAAGVAHYGTTERRKKKTVTGRSTDGHRRRTSDCDAGLLAAAAATSSDFLSDSNIVIKTIDVDGVVSSSPAANASPASADAAATLEPPVSRASDLARTPSPLSGSRSMSALPTSSSAAANGTQREWSEIESLIDLFESVFNSRSPVVPLSVWEDTSQAPE